MEEKKVSFEENLSKLDKLVKELESGSLSLDDSLKSFEEGIKLCKVLEEKLKDAEDKIKEISAKE